MAVGAGHRANRGTRVAQTEVQPTVRSLKSRAIGAAALSHHGAVAFTLYTEISAFKDNSWMQHDLYGAL